MRILVVAHAFPRVADDMAGAFVLDLARGQMARGHEVAAVVPHATGLAQQEVLDGVTVHRFRYGRDEQETLAYTGTMADQVLRSWRARWRLVRFVLAMRRAVRAVVHAWRPDVIHVHWWFPGGFAIWPKAGAFPPVIITSHGTDLFLADRVAPLRALARRVFAAADRVTVISTPLVARAEALGVPAAHITVCPMPIGDLPAPVGAARVPRRMLFVGRLTERKGAVYAIDALATLRASGHDATLVIVGDGPEQDALVRHVSLRGVAPFVTFRGRLTPVEVRREYAHATVFVMPAITDWKGEQEGFGLVLVEAMLGGLPVVASRSGGIADVVRDGETGWLVAERDVAGLAAAIQHVFEHPAHAMQVAAAAQLDVGARFSPEGIARTFEGAYLDAVRGAAA